jgi:hypothetical protein
MPDRLIKMLSRILIAAMFYTCTSQAAYSEVLQGRWEKVELLPAGTQVTVYIDSGEILECYLFNTSRDILLVVTSISREQRRIPKDSVVKIVARNYDDSLKNGAFIGLASGAATGITITALINTTRHRSGVGDRILGTLLFGLIGMGIGVLIDFRHQGQETVYEAAKKNPSKE